MVKGGLMAQTLGLKFLACFSVFYLCRSSCSDDNRLNLRTTDAVMKRVKPSYEDKDGGGMRR